MYPTDPENGLKVPNSLAQATSGNRILHASLFTVARDGSLAITLPGLLGGADQNCNKAGDPPPNQPNLVICEEVRLNGST